MVKCFRAVGVDPGFAKTGVAALEQCGAVVSCVALKLVETRKDKSLRAGMDDIRRVGLFRSQIEAFVREIQPDVLAVEQYMVYDTHGVEELRAGVGAFVSLLSGVYSSSELSRAFSDPRVGVKALGALAKLRKTLKGFSAQRGRGAAAKTVGVFHVVADIGTRLEIPVGVQPPVDIKRAMTGKKSASKEDIQQALCSEVKGFEEQLMAFPKTKREHVADAAAHALLRLRIYRATAQESAPLAPGA